MLYLFFYLIMKVRKDGKRNLLVWAYALITLVLAIFSLYFLSRYRTNQELSAAQSRDLNEECVLLGFYDSGDIWHFLSALGLFFSSVTLLVIDDDMNDAPRHHIFVF